jgi:peptide/nickel transport system substrate-binding protein
MALNNSRRRTALVGMTVAALAAMTACSSSGNGSSGNSSSDNKGVTIAIAVEPTSLDPCDTQAANGVGVIKDNITQSLTDIDPQTGKVIPLLALSWTHVDADDWVFKLRPNVKFQDGTTFDAQTAAQSLERTLNPKLDCLNLEQFPDPLKFTVVNSLTLKVTTPQPDPILPLRMSYADISSPNTPASAKTADPIGTGPYKFASRDPGQDLKLVRWSGYWGPKPEPASITYIYRSQDSIRADTAKTGEASIAVPIAVQDATNNNLTKSYTQDRVFFLRLETNKPPLNDLRVREAIQLAINKDQIVSALMGKGGKPYDQMVAPSVNAYIPGYKAPAYNPTQAKALLAQAKAAGVDTSAQIEFISRSDLFPGADDVMQAIVQDLTQAGLNIKMLDLDDNAYLSQLKAPNNPKDPVNIMAVTHDNESGDASFSLPKYMQTGGTVSTIHDPTLDALLNQANVAEGAQRAKLYQEAALREYQADVAIIPIAEQFSLLLLAPGVEYQPNGLTGIELKGSDITFGNG